jgi:hypothetical protein
LITFSGVDGRFEMENGVRGGPPEWRKSRRCDTASCVEVAVTGAGVQVRDEAGSMLIFSGGAWRVFLLEARKAS